MNSFNKDYERPILYSFLAKFVKPFLLVILLVIEALVELLRLKATKKIPTEVSSDTNLNRAGCIVYKAPKEVAADWLDRLFTFEAEGGDLR